MSDLIEFFLCPSHGCLAVVLGPIVGFAVVGLTWVARLVTRFRNRKESV